MEQANIPVQVKRFSLMGREIGAALLEEAGAVHADLLVMGAYSHNQFIERMFGGATADVMKHLSLPIAVHH
jgi:nucleotide-binding universal stress UspA family protein